MNSVDEVIEGLRHQVVLGGGWGSIHTSDLERIAHEITLLRDHIELMKANLSEMDAQARY